MQQQDFLYSNSDKNFFLKKMLSGILFLLLFGIFYMYSFIILMTIESIDRNFLAEYFYIMRVGVATSLSYIFMFLFYDKKNPLLSISKLLLLLFIASFFSFVFAYLFKNSPFWVLKYSIGIITGLFFYFIYKKEKGNSLSGVVSLFALLLCENLERFFYNGSTRLFISFIYQIISAYISLVWNSCICFFLVVFFCRGIFDQK